MSDAERQHRRRERLGIDGPCLQAHRPWSGVLSDSRRESEAIHAIEWWLEEGDMDAVTEWLANHLAMRDDESEEVLKMLAAKVREPRKE
jgi:hypothetical protein